MSTDTDYTYESFSVLELMNTTENEMITTNTTLQSCEIRRLQGSPLPLSPAATDALRYIQLVYYFGGLFVSLVLNVYLIALIAKCKKLQSMSFYLILQIIAIDLIHCVILFPASIINILINDWAFGFSLCPTIGMMVVLARHTRNFLMLVLAIDRLCSVFLPFWFIRHRKQVIVPLSFGAWLMAFILALIPVTGLLDCYGFQRFTWICLLGRGCRNQDACNFFQIFTVSVSAFSVFVSFILYLILLCKAKRLNKIVVPSLSVFTSDTTDTGAIKTDGGSESITEQSSINARKQKTEKRATITFLIFFLALFGVVFPSFIFFVVGPQILRLLQVQRPPRAYIIFAVICRSLFSSLVFIDPIALMRNSDVREVNSKVLARLKAKLLKKH